MKKTILTTAFLVISQNTFAFEATSKTMASASMEIFFSTAISAVTSEISSFSASEARKNDARKILREVEEYNQTGSMTSFIAEKINIIHSLDNSLSVDDSIDVLIEISESVLTN